MNKLSYGKQEELFIIPTISYSKEREYLSFNFLKFYIAIIKQ